MKTLFFSAKPYDERSFVDANRRFGHELRFVESRLNTTTADLVRDEPAVCVFVNDLLDQAMLTRLHAAGVKLIALRCAGYDNVDVAAARQLGLTLVRVPAYSPHAVAEHTLCLILALNRKIHRAYCRVRDGNFSLDGLLGFDLAGRTAGVIGTGNIGAIVARILKGFGMQVLAHDPVPDAECQRAGVRYVDKAELFAAADVISLHCPATRDTYHMIDAAALAQMKDNVMLINTSRGVVLDTNAIIRALKDRKIGYLGLDVYEEESELFFEDLSSEIIQDDVFERLLTFPNVLVTAHQGFFTADALANIAETTLQAMTDFEQGGEPANRLGAV